MEEEIVEEATELETPAVAPAIEEIDTAPKPIAASPAKPGAIHKREEPPPNPLLLDPYVWEGCTITVGYSLLPDGTVSVSVHNHKDEPILKTFPAAEVTLPERIRGVITQLQTIWPTSPVNVTIVLLPKQDEADERSIIASVRVANDTPIVQEGVESNLPFPAPIRAMLDELKALIPERGLKNIEKNAKTKVATVTKPATKPSAQAAAPVNKNIRKDQMTLF